MTLADDIIATNLARLSKDCERAYEVCKTRPTPEFWKRCDALEQTLYGRLARRPITKPEIACAVLDFQKEFRHLCAARIR